MDFLTLICRTIDIFSYVLQMLIMARIIVSWLPIPRGSRFVQLLHTLTEPILGPIRSLISKSPLGGPGMMLDFSPLIAMVLLSVLTPALINIIISLAR